MNGALNAETLGYLSWTGYWGGGMHAVYSMSRAEDKLVANR